MTRSNQGPCFPFLQVNPMPTIPNRSLVERILILWEFVVYLQLPIVRRYFLDDRLGPHSWEAQEIQVEESSGLPIPGVESGNYVQDEALERGSLKGDSLR